MKFLIISAKYLTYFIIVGLLNYLLWGQPFTLTWPEITGLAIILGIVFVLIFLSTFIPNFIKGFKLEWAKQKAKSNANR